MNLDIECEKNGALVILTCIWSQVECDPIPTVTYDPGPFRHTELVGRTIRVLAAVIERTVEGKTPFFSLLATLKLEAVEENPNIDIFTVTKNKVIIA